MRYFLGVDTGATKSHALIADERGCALGFGEGGRANPHVIGYEAFTQVVCATVRQALAQAGVGGDQIAGIGMGVGGFDWPSERGITLAALDPLGLSAPREVVNDAALGIYAGTEEGWGIAVVSGTGSNCRGRDRRGRWGRVLGYGPLLGEGAGAYELAVKAVEAIALEWSRRGPATRLTPAFVELLGVKDAEALLELVTRSGGRLPGGEAAPLIFRLAAEGDPVSLSLVLWAGHELASLVCGVARQLELEDEEFDVVLVGGMFNAGALLVETFQRDVRQFVPHARFVRLGAPPVVGAALMGMEQAGLKPYPLRRSLTESAVQLLQETA